MFKKTILLLIVMVFSMTCAGNEKIRFFHNPDLAKIHKRSFCDPDRPFPQMIMIPFFGKATQIVPSCNLYEKHKTSLSMIIFYQQWVENFGDDDHSVRRMLEDVMIEWDVNKKTVKKAYNLKGEKVINVRVNGLARGGNYTWIWAGYVNKISETSLMHELVHLSLRAKNGHGDADHEGKKYKGWTWEHTSLVIKTKNILRTFNI